MDSIYIAYAMYMIYIFFVYINDIPKLMPQQYEQMLEDVVGQEDSEAHTIQLDQTQMEMSIVLHTN